MSYVSAYVIALLVFGAIDAIWLTTMGNILYRPVLKDILLDDLRLAPALAFYFLFPIGLLIFCVFPGLRAPSVGPVLLSGLLFGAFAYATYDLTNYATLRNWNLTITLADITYGAVASAAAATAAWYGLRLLPPSLGGVS